MRSWGALLLLIALDCTSNSAHAQFFAPPPIEITGYSPDTIAMDLAIDLLDNNTFTLIEKGDKKPRFEGDTEAAGFATFGFTGLWDVLEEDVPESGRHFLAPYFTDGAVMLTGYKIINTDVNDGILMSADAAAEAPPELPPDAKHYVALTFSATAKIDGWVKFPWAFCDPGYNLIADFDTNAPPDTNGTFRFLINGVNKGLTGDNRFVSVQTMLRHFPDAPDEALAERDPSNNIGLLFDSRDFAQGLINPILEMEFGGIAFSQTTLAVQVEKGDELEFRFVVWASALFVRPHNITVTAVDQCSKDTDCNDPALRCCAGYCCSIKVYCCEDECCTSQGSRCLPPANGTSTKCCPTHAVCLDENNQRMCCPPGYRCENNSTCSLGLYNDLYSPFALFT